MNFIESRPYAEPEKAARRITELAHAVEPVQDGRIHIEKINGPFLFKDKGRPAEYGAGMKLAIDRGWLEMHESGTFVRFTPTGAELFAQGGRSDAPRKSARRTRAGSCRFPVDAEGHRFKAHFSDQQGSHSKADRARPGGVA
jgi:hypothetical protein